MSDLLASHLKLLKYFHNDIGYGKIHSALQVGHMLYSKDIALLGVTNITNC